MPKGANQEAWWSLDWLSWETLQGYEYAHPIWLKLIPFLLLVFVGRWLLGRFYRPQFKVATFKDQLPQDWWSLSRFLNPLFGLLALAFICIALARPQKTSETTERYTRGIDIMITLDISRSMELEDFKPNRLDATKQVASDFVAERKGDRIGLTIFSGEAYSLCPLTTDHELLQGYIQDLNFEMIKKQGTAIGSALGVSLNRIRETTSPSRVIILLSDGENNAGHLDPRAVASMADAYGVRIYTIGVGKEGKIAIGTDAFGRTQYARSNIDLELLKEVASSTGARFFRATNNEALESIFSEIDELEKTDIVENHYVNTQDYYPIYLYWAMVFLLAWLLFKLPVFSNVFTD